ncbi:MAG: hypothetical protein ABIU54_09655 [Candidatus Eisenbacteria bacterium]
MNTPSAGGGDEPPPLLGSWTMLYALVIGALVVTLVLLLWLTWAFT